MNKQSTSILQLGLGIALLAMTFASASAAEEPGPADLSAQADFLKAQQWVTCTPENVAVYSSRIHVKCTVPIAGIQWFALSTQNSSHAARILSILTAAHVTGRDLSILYDPADTSGTAIGCQANDCRLIVAAAIL